MKKRVVISAAVAALILFTGCEKKESESVRHEPQSAEKMQSVTEPTKAMEEKAAEEKTVEESTAEQQQEAQKGETEAKESPITEKVTEAAKEAEQKASEIAESVKEGAKAAAAALAGAASKPAGVDAEALYKSKCAGCHGANGKKHALGKSNLIAGQTKALLVQKIQGYKDGSFGGAMKKIMQGQVSSLSEEQIEALSDYISKLK